MRILCLLVMVPLLAACRPATPSQTPHTEVRLTYEEAAGGSSDVAGTYGLVAFDGAGLPALAAAEGGCRVELTDGELDLTEDGRYRLRLAARSVCNGEVEDHGPGDDVSVEGLFALEGFQLRFGDWVILSRRDPAPETITGPEELVNALFPEGRLAARGSVRVDRVSFTLPDLRTFTFSRT